MKEHLNAEDCLCDDALRKRFVGDFLSEADRDGTNSDSRLAYRSPVKQYRSVHSLSFDPDLATTPPLARQLAAMISRSAEVRKRRSNLPHSQLHRYRDGNSLRAFNQAFLSLNGDDDDEYDSNDSEILSFATNSHSDSQSVTEGVEKLSLKSLSDTGLTSSTQPGDTEAANYLLETESTPGDSSDEEDSGNPSKKSKSSYDLDHVRLLACPYFKLDPARYSEANTLEINYRGCSSVYLRDIARVKQHLYRVHQQPGNLCPRCSALFPNAQELDAHFRSRVACEASVPAFPERFSERQCRELKRRWPRDNVIESWMRIWRILFPEVQCPRSPYLEDVLKPATDVQEVTNVSDFIADFRARAPGMLQGILQETLRPQQSAGLATWLRSREATLVLEESVGRLIRRIAPSLLHSTTVPPAPLPELPLSGFTEIDSATGDFYDLPSSVIWDDCNFLQILDDLLSADIWDDCGFDTSLEGFGGQQLNDRTLVHVPADSADVPNTQPSTREPWMNLLRDAEPESTSAGEDAIFPRLHRCTGVRT